MRARAAAAIGVVVLALGWWGWPAEAPAPSRAERASAPPPSRLFASPPASPRALDPRLQAALDTCRRCAEGSLVGAVCGACDAASLPQAPPEPEALPAAVWLDVDVVNEDGGLDERARVQVSQCPVTGRQGNRFEVAAGLQCLVQAYRRDGALWLPSAPVVVDVGADGAYAQVELPRARVGGLGVHFAVGPDGVVVRDVMPGSPADAMGLEPGDRIMAVEGRPTAGLSQSEFVRTVTGPVGTEIALEIAHRDGTDTIRLRRAELGGS